MRARLVTSALLLSACGGGSAAAPPPAPGGASSPAAEPERAEAGPLVRVPGLRYAQPARAIHEEVLLARGADTLSIDLGLAEEDLEERTSRVVEVMRALSGQEPAVEERAALGGTAWLVSGSGDRNGTAIVIRVLFAELPDGRQVALTQDARADAPDPEAFDAIVASLSLDASPAGGRFVVGGLWFAAPGYALVHTSHGLEERGRLVLQALAPDAEDPLESLTTSDVGQSREIESVERSEAVVSGRAARRVSIVVTVSEGDERFEEHAVEVPLDGGRRLLILGTQTTAEVFDALLASVAIAP